MLHPVPRDNVYTTPSDLRRNGFKPAAAEQVLQKELAEIPLSKAHVLSSLETLANGEPLSLSQANELFNTLIYCEAYTVFVDAFEQWSLVVEKGAPDASGEPFARCLTLELPADWAPRDTVGLAQAFQKIQANRAVDRVVVLAPPCRTFAHSPDLSAVAVDSTLPVPEAVNGCIAELIKGGTTQLCLRGTLNVHSVHQVSHALIGSKLASIEIDPKMKATSGFASEDQRSSFSDLLKSLLWCDTLKHLSLGHPELVKQYGEFAHSPTLPRGGATLESVDLHCGVVGTDADRAIALTRLMRLVNGMQTLSVVGLHGAFVGFKHLEETVLTPLMNNPRLTRLALHGMHGGPSWSTEDPMNMHALPRLVGFATTCPHLSQIRWELASGADALNMAASPWPEPSPELDAEIAAMVNILETEDALPLASLIVDNVPIPVPVARAFRRAVQNHASLREAVIPSHPGDSAPLTTSLNSTTTRATTDMTRTTITAPHGASATTGMARENPSDSAL